MSSHQAFSSKSIWSNPFVKYSIFISTTIILYFLKKNFLEAETSRITSNELIGGTLLSANSIYVFFFLFRVQYKFVTLRKENPKQLFRGIFLILSSIVSMGGLVITISSFLPLEITNEIGFESMFGIGIGMLFSGIYQFQYFTAK